jgi:hypothetical protein
MPTHLAKGEPSATAIPITSVLIGLTRKQPLFMRSGPLPNIPYKRLKSISETNPNLIYFHAPNLGAPLLPMLTT